jgi:hypothetical protein
MDHNTVVVLFKQDPAIAALRKDWLPLAVSFLHQAFKTRHVVQIPQQTFAERLDLFIEHVNETLSDTERYKHKSDYYIDRWSREDSLIRIRMSSEGHIVQLTSYAERLLGWFEDMQQRGVIGTESRLLNIITLLEDVVTRSTEDVDMRLKQLYDQRDEIDAQIRRIEETGEVDGLTDLQIRERLDHTRTIARQLLRDFGLVEERFREMALEIQQAQLDPHARRGDILGTALDAEEQLATSDEGLSFRAFYELLTTPQRRNRFEELLAEVFTNARFTPYTDGNMLLRRLTTYLLDAGDRVNQSNQRLTEHLRRVVDTRNITESRRVQTLAGEIKHLVSQLGDEIVPLTQSRKTFYVLEGDPMVELPLERPLFEPPTIVEYSDRPQNAHITLDDEAVFALYDIFYIDEAVLQQRIRRALMSSPEVTLVELVDMYPLEKGMAELITYVRLAATTSAHTVDTSRATTILVRSAQGEPAKTITLPQIVFRAQTAPSGAAHD